MKSQQLPVCFICEGSLTSYLSGSDFLYKTTKKTFNIYKCASCGLERILPIPSRKEIERFYPTHYYSYLDKNNKSFFMRLREKVVEISYKKEVQKDIFYYLALAARKNFTGLPLIPNSIGSLLDIGCGDGYNLDLMQKYGWKCVGFEIGKRVKKNNIYYDSDITKVRFNMKFDYIRFWHVLEHVPNPEQVVEKISTLLAKNGVVVVGVPNTASLYAKVFKKYWYGRDIPRHLFNYNLENLIKLFESKNMAPIEIRYVSAGGFIGSVQHMLNTNFHKNYNLVNNQILFLFTYPIDCLVNIFKQGDSISVAFRIK